MKKQKQTRPKAQSVYNRSQPRLRRSAPSTPLDAWLTKHKLTNAQFAEELRVLQGPGATSPTYASVSEWRTGRCVPRRSMQGFVEIATGGEVALQAWLPRRLH
jgi:hypothetical protein